MGDKEEGYKIGIIHLIRTLNFPKKEHFWPLIGTRTCAYQGVRNISFSVNFAYVLTEWFHRASPSPPVPWFVSVLERKLIGPSLNTHIRNIFLAYINICLKFTIFENGTGLINESKNLPGAYIEPTQTSTLELFCENS